MNSRSLFFMTMFISVVILLCSIHMHMCEGGYEDGPKRFMRFGKRFTHLGKFYDPHVDQDDDESGLDAMKRGNRFMRFG